MVQAGNVSGSRQYVQLRFWMVAGLHVRLLREGAPALAAASGRRQVALSLAFWCRATGKGGLLWQMCVSCMNLKGDKTV